MQDQGKRLLLVVALMLGVFLVWSLLAKPDEQAKQAQTASQPNASITRPNRILSIIGILRPGSSASSRQRQAAWRGDQ